MTITQYALRLLCGYDLRSLWEMYLQGLYKLDDLVEDENGDYVFKYGRLQRND